MKMNEKRNKLRISKQMLGQFRKADKYVFLGFGQCREIIKSFNVNGISNQIDEIEDDMM